MRRMVITVSLVGLLLAGLAGFVLGSLTGGSEEDPATIVSTAVDSPVPTTLSAPLSSPEPRAFESPVPTAPPN